MTPAAIVTPFDMRIFDRRRRLGLFLLLDRGLDDPALPTALGHCRFRVGRNAIVICSSRADPHQGWRVPSRAIWDWRLTPWVCAKIRWRGILESPPPLLCRMTVGTRDS